MQADVHDDFGIKTSQLPFATPDQCSTSPLKGSTILGVSLRLNLLGLRVRCLMESITRHTVALNLKSCCLERLAYVTVLSLQSNARGK